MPMVLSFGQREAGQIVRHGTHEVFAFGFPTVCLLIRPVKAAAFENIGIIQVNLHVRRIHLGSIPSPIDWLPVRQLPGWAIPDSNHPNDNNANSDNSNNNHESPTS